MSEVIEDCKNSCQRCGKVKLQTEFAINKDSKIFQYSKTCQECADHGIKIAHQARKDKFKKEREEGKYKGLKRECIYCHQEKDIELFVRGVIGYRNKCLECRKSDRIKEYWAGRIDDRHIPKPEPRSKTCSKCGMEKEINSFRKNSNACKECISIQNKAYNLKNKEKRMANAKVYEQKNYERIRQKRKKYSIENREKILTKLKERKSSDPVFKLKCILRTQVYRSLKGGIKAARTFELVGCSPEELKTWLESHFEPGMSWNNYNHSGWHVDHRQPINSYNLLDPIQQKECFHFSNLFPRWSTTEVAKEKGSKRMGNMNKSDKIIGVDFHEPLL